MIMKLSDDNRTLLVVAGVMLLIYLLLCPKTVSRQVQSSEAPVLNNDDDSMVINNRLPQNMDAVEGFASEMVEDSNEPVPGPSEDENAYFESNDYSPPQDYLDNKYTSRNHASGEYKNVSYNGAARGNIGTSDWDQFFDSNNNIIADSQSGSNNQFSPSTELEGNFASFESDGNAPCGSNQNCKPEELFDVDKYLPQEVNDDWFEVQPEPVSVKNRHLINVTKPIGINTIGTSLRNASYDIRGTPACPKFVVSPWLQSSIEPDTNLKPVV
jgi:hypothetical protein